MDNQLEAYHSYMSLKMDAAGARSIVIIRGCRISVAPDVDCALIPCGQLVFKN
jgi:hypothetical protein